jgi:hypothetical protein
VEVIYVSTPGVVLAASSPDERRYFVSASIIYVPPHLVRQADQPHTDLT